MQNTTNPKCPQCGRIKAVQRAGDYLKCNGCGALFDNDISEGGSYYDDPTKRIEREEACRFNRHSHRNGHRD